MDVTTATSLRWSRAGSSGALSNRRAHMELASTRLRTKLEHEQVQRQLWRHAAALERGIHREQAAMCGLQLRIGELARQRQRFLDDIGRESRRRGNLRRTHAALGPCLPLEHPPRLNPANP